MPPPPRILRGVKDIRTRSATPDQTLVPYKAYMVITALEMEKYRRQTERRDLITRLKNVCTRLRFIDAETAALLDRLGRLPTPQVGVRRAAGGKRPTPRPTGEFKLKY